MVSGTCLQKQSCNKIVDFFPIFLSIAFVSGRFEPFCPREYRQTHPQAFVLQLFNPLRPRSQQDRHDTQKSKNLRPRKLSTFFQPQEPYKGSIIRA